MNKNEFICYLEGFFKTNLSLEDKEKLRNKITNLTVEPYGKKYYTNPWANNSFFYKEG